MSLLRLGTRAALVLACASVLAAPARAQDYFGQNQVQYDHFDWQVIETEHFTVHYYPALYPAAMDAARMAERAYGRLSRILDHQFREKKPIILFASRSDFGQNNVLGDLGEGVQGVTEAQRHRILLPFTGDYRTFDHVLTHEMVHEFQYDIYSRGKAGNGIQTLAQVNPPLWFTEGMAEYLSIGPDHPFTASWMRDAALNGFLPTIEQMGDEPDRYFPYRYGESVWRYVGQRWGDEIIGEILNASASIGVERAFRRETGMSLDDLSDEWRESIQNEYLPAVAQLQRPRRFAQPLLTERRSGGQIFVGPALSNDGKYIAFLSNGNFFRGQVFIDLWLADAETGKRIKRLVKSTTNPDAEELQLVASQSSFSPDGKWLAYTAQRKGKDVLYLLNVKRRKTERRFDLPLEEVSGPSWSPDGKRIVMSGNVGGITDLYIVDVDDVHGRHLQRLTNDKYGDLQPQWSPDGNTIAFTSDRSPESDVAQLRMAKYHIALLHLDTHQIEELPNQAGVNLNPMWAPDGRSIAYISDRSGSGNVFLYDFDEHAHYQLTNVVGMVASFTEFTPCITWARDADKLAFTYFENGNYTVWTIDNPRLLKAAPYIPTTPAATLAATQRTDSAANALGHGAATADSTQMRQSYYRSPAGVRVSAVLPTMMGRDTSIMTVAELLDSASIGLPDTTRFKKYKYHAGFQPDYVAEPTVGYANSGYGSGIFGGTAIVLSDLLGNSRLAFAGQVNGRLADARLFAGYTNLGHRLQYTTGIYQEPYYFPVQDDIVQLDPVVSQQNFAYSTLVVRQAYGVGLYPFDRFRRVETGARVTSLDETIRYWSRLLDSGTGLASNWNQDSVISERALTYASPYLALVKDNTLFGYTGPIAGQRYRFQVEPTIGNLRWMEYVADYRRYDPILFDFLTIATRFSTDQSYGPDERKLPKYIATPDFVRGYSRQNYFTNVCFGFSADQTGCSSTELSGSRVAFANAELRFPVLRRVDLGILPVSLPPLEGLIFYDAGVAWSGGQSVTLKKPDNYDPNNQRYVLRSYGAGLRLNLFGYAIVRWDYAIPLDRTPKKGFWVWSIGPSF